MNHFDAIVIGMGGVGSASLFHLARRGARVLGIDRFSAGHDRGSSHGQTRIIRQAYFEHASYVPLLQRAYQLWRELEEMVEESLYFPVGLLEVGPPQGVVVPGVLKAAREHNLEVETVDVAEIADRFPGFTVADGDHAIFEREAGYLRVEECVLAHLKAAAKYGAQHRFHETVVSWRCLGDGVEVSTDKATYSAGRLVIAAGAWANSLLRDLGHSLHVVRKHLHWYATSDQEYQQRDGAPTFFYEAAGGYFYGFPSRDNLGLKIAEHSGGELVADPLTVDRSVDPADQQRVETFLRTYLPQVTTTQMAHAVCLYTMSADEHFLLDHHPRHSQVAFAAGLSGHGFKFTSVLGEAMAQLILERRTDLPIDFLRLDRPTLR